MLVFMYFFHVLGTGRGLMGSLLSWISMELIEQGTGVAARLARYLDLVSCFSGSIFWGK